MPRRRWIDPSFWDDEDVGDLTFQQRVFFVGCWSHADDEGRLRGNPAFLRGAIFKYDDISLEQVLETRDTVLATMTRSLALYQSNGRDYLAFDEKHWKRYQNPNHPKPSTLPAPTEGLFADIQEVEGEPTEGRKRAEGEPMDDSEASSDVDRVGLDRVGLDRVGGNNGKNFSEIFTELTGVLVATGVQAEEMDAWMEDIPEDWFRDACKEAVDNNARKWAYVRAILKRWKKEGKKGKRGTRKRRDRERLGDDASIPDYDAIAERRQAEGG